MAALLIGCALCMAAGWIAAPMGPKAVAVALLTMVGTLFIRSSWAD